MEQNMENIKQRIDALLEQQERVILAIEGKCTSGKTTLAAALAEQYDCNVFHMDDYFLQPHQRTPERFAEVGGNVDYERFLAEVLLPLQGGKPFAYRPFDCGSFTLGQPVEVQPKKLNIVEGTYCLHPYFADPYDLKVLLTVSEEQQHQRILQRPAFLHTRFFEEWIPMENRYFGQLSRDVDLIL
jgi:uridine kinase